MNKIALAMANTVVWLTALVSAMTPVVRLLRPSASLFQGVVGLRVDTSSCKIGSVSLLGIIEISINAVVHRGILGMLFIVVMCENSRGPTSIWR